MPTIPYLHFRGDCAQALAFYAGALGGTGLALMRYAESPTAPDDWRASDRVLHGQVTIGTGTLMASDFPPGLDGDPQRAVSVMQTFADPASTRAAFDRLSRGGAVIQAFGPTFFSPGFGMLRDRFGTHWILSAEPERGAPPRDPLGEGEVEAHPT